MILRRIIKSNPIRINTPIPDSTAYAHHFSGKLIINSRSRWAIIFHVSFISPGISPTFSPSDGFGVSVTVGVFFPDCTDAVPVFSLLSEALCRFAAISSIVISCVTVFSSSSLSEFPPLITLSPQPSEPWRGVPPAKAIAIGRTARNTLIIPVIIRRKYSLFKKRKTYPTAIPMQQSPAIIVP